jgi:hypothetical protein
VAGRKWADAERESWRLFLLLSVLAKRREAFIRDLRQGDAIDLIDPVNPVFQLSGNSNRQAGILF